RLSSWGPVGDTPPERTRVRRTGIRVRLAGSDRGSVEHTALGNGNRSHTRRRKPAGPDSALVTAGADGARAVAARTRPGPPGPSGALLGAGVRRPPGDDSEVQPAKLLRDGRTRTRQPHHLGPDDDQLADAVYRSEAVRPLQPGIPGVRRVSHRPCTHPPHERD